MKKKRAHRPKSTAPIGSFLVNNLLWLLDQIKVPIFTQATVTELLKDDASKIKGVKVQIAGESKTIFAPAVILATGGFGASKQLLKRYRPDLLAYKTTNQVGATGWDHFSRAYWSASVTDGNDPDPSDRATRYTTYLFDRRSCAW